MIRAVVLEKDSGILERLVALLADYVQVVIIGKATDGVIGLDLCVRLRPDAVFLDFDLLGGDGQPLATQLVTLSEPPLLVFTASSSERASDAFRLGGVDYLMHPLDPLQVTEAVNRLLGQLRPIEFGEIAGSPASAILWLNTAYVNEPAHSLLPVTDVDHDQIRLLARHEIVAILRRNRRTWIHTVLEEFPTYYPLGQLIHWLRGDPFIQVGRHAVVNLRAVQDVHRQGDGLYRLTVHDRNQTQITTTRSGSLRLAAMLRARASTLVPANT